MVSPALNVLSSRIIRRLDYRERSVRRLANNQRSGQSNLLVRALCLGLLDSVEKNLYCAITHIKGRLYDGCNRRAEKVLNGNFVKRQKRKIPRSTQSYR